MSLHSNSIPDDPDQLANWLDERIIGDELPGFVAELAAIHRISMPPKSSLSSVLPEPLIEEVLSGGIARIPRTSVKTLLKQPFSLLELRERVLLDGGPFWDKLLTQQPTNAQNEAMKELILSKIATPTITHFGRSKATDILNSLAPQPVELKRNAIAKRRWYSNPGTWIANVLTAACVFLATVSLRPPREVTKIEPGTKTNVEPKETNKDSLVWTKSELLASINDPDKYLRTIASLEEWWGAAPPTETRIEFASRIGELRRGCSMLINSPHATLPEKERELLIAKCREWATQIASIQETLDDPASNYLLSKNQADNLIRRMSTRLKTGFKT